MATLVTDEDRERLAPKMHARRRVEHLAGRALLRHALAIHTGADAASFRFEVAEGGKPACVGGPQISLSHSRDFFVCALADHSVVGIDVEAGGPLSPPRELAERFFTPAEARWVAEDPEFEVRFHMLWVLKESYLKALGVGLAGGLSALECRIEPPVIVARVESGAVAPQLSLLELQGVYVGVACLAPEPIEVIAHAFASDEEAGSPELMRSIAGTG